MTPGEHLKQTRHATEQLFKSLEFYYKQLEQLQPVIFISSTVDDIASGKEFGEWRKQNEAAISASIEKEKEYLGYALSEGTICGSILQIASMSIKTFSVNTLVSPECKAILSKGNAVKFCVGRLVRGLPTGLIVYAGRNQYNHMDDLSYNEVTTKVFDHLATHGTGGKYRDPAFDLTNRSLINYAANIVALLGWKKYADYSADMKLMMKI